MCHGSEIPVEYIKPNRVYEFIYKNGLWELVGDIDTNTAHGHISGVGITMTDGDGGISGTVGYKAKLRNETALTIDSSASTTTPERVYPVAIDKSGYLAVNVPWINTNVNTTYDLSAPASKTNGSVTIDLKAGGSGSGTDSVKIKGTNATSVTTDANGVIIINSTNYSAATQSSTGLMSADDKKKLDGIASGATKITVDSSLSSTSTNPIQNKAVNAALNLKEDAWNIKTHTLTATNSSFTPEENCIHLVHVGSGVRRIDINNNRNCYIIFSSTPYITAIGVPDQTNTGFNNFETMIGKCQNIECSCIASGSTPRWSIVAY